MNETIILEQYRQAWEQRRRESNVQMQLLGIGNTVLGGILIAAISVNDILTTTVLSGIAVPISFFLFVSYRKHVYFEDLFSENIEAIEQSIPGIKHIQYDTYPHKEDSLHYTVRYPGKRGLERVTPHSIMYSLLCMYFSAAYFMLYRFGSKLLPIWSLIVLMILVPVLCYILTSALRNPVRIGNGKILESRKSKE